MKSLNDGVVTFREQDYEIHRELFQELGRKQNPHTLFIGCSDSRIVPNLMTNTLPGELFVVRNVANLVPRYRESEEFLSTTSAIEYAVQVLQVKTIIVCGHSNCGGCSALYADDDFFRGIPHTRKWLELAAPIKQKVLAQLPNAEFGAREWLTEQYNVVEQINHLLTYPFVKARYDAGELQLHGWYYIIETGEIFQYDSEKGFFVLMN
jgi:carbonic anhydrase